MDFTAHNNLLANAERELLGGSASPGLRGGRRWLVRSWAGSREQDGLVCAGSPSHLRNPTLGGGSGRRDCP